MFKPPLPSHEGVNPLGTRAYSEMAYTRSLDPMCEDEVNERGASSSSVTIDALDEKGHTDFIQIPGSFSLDDRILHGLAMEAESPYYSESEEPFDSESPLSTPPTSNAPSRAPSPIEHERASCASRSPVVEPPVREGLTRKEKLKARSKKAGKANRKKKVAKAKAAYQPKKRALRKFVQGSDAFKLEYIADKFKIATTGYISQRQDTSKKIYKLVELTGPTSKFKFKYVKWDGRRTVPIVEAKKRVITVLAGMPERDPGWNSLQQRLSDRIEKTRPNLTFPTTKKCKEPRRGKFRALNIGISHGNGQKSPRVRKQHAANLPIVDELLRDPDLARVSGFASQAFLTWAPGLYKYYEETLLKLLEKYPDQHRNWPNSPWASITINFGPQTVCYKHADFANLAYGWCAVTALGNYDHTKGGHLVLWELGLVIEFPAGSTILIPSSAIQHSNVPIQAGERRYSVTQYSAGGIFRWVENGFVSVDDIMKTLDDAEKDEMYEKLADQLAHGLSLFATI